MILKKSTAPSRRRTRHERGAGRAAGPSLPAPVRVLSQTAPPRGGGRLPPLPAGAALGSGGRGGASRGVLLSCAPPRCGIRTRSAPPSTAINLRGSGATAGPTAAWWPSASRTTWPDGTTSSPGSPCPGRGCASGAMTRPCCWPRRRRWRWTTWRPRPCVRYGTPKPSPAWGKTTPPAGPTCSAPIRSPIPPVEGRRVLLIDDIVTTGSTLSECARVLRTAGAADVVCAALARSRRSC